MGDITKNFSFSEFQRSSRAAAAGINNNIPTRTISLAIRDLVESVLQPLRDRLGAPIIINSGYRCPALNKLVNGAKGSQHMKGEAADIRCAFYKPVDLARMILRMDLPFDQVILYNTFVHVSHRYGGTQRGRILYDAEYTGEKVGNNGDKA